MNTKKTKKRPIKLFQLFSALVVLFFLFYLTDTKTLEEIQPGEAPVLYSTICRDNLEELFFDAIQKANHSILLIIYSLSDTKLIHALNKQAEKGVHVKVVHDMTTPPFGFQKLSNRIDIQGIKLSGLMHRKILVVDSEKVWLGSANWTSESLKLHDNLVIGVINHQLAEAIEGQKSSSFNSGGQQVEFWSLPQTGKEGLQRLIQLIDRANRSVRVAMFTWTHNDLTQAIIDAHQRGVSVEILLDRGQAHGVCHATLERLLRAGIDVRLNSGLGLLHHKFAWIDEEFLVNGSANWTVAAFKRNHDCFLILHPLTKEQQEKMGEIWRKTKILTNQELPLRLAA